MVYLHVTAQLHRGKTYEFVRNFEKSLPIVEAAGQHLVGAWRTTYGNYDEIVDLFSFESLADMERVRKEVLREPPETLKVLFPFIQHEQSKLMVPLPYSPLK